MGVPDGLLPAWTYWPSYSSPTWTCHRHVLVRNMSHARTIKKSSQKSLRNAFMRRPIRANRNSAARTTPPHATPYACLSFWAEAGLSVLTMKAALAIRGGGDKLTVVPRAIVRSPKPAYCNDRQEGWFIHRQTQRQDKSASLMGVGPGSTGPDAPYDSLLPCPRVPLPLCEAAAFP